MRVLVAMLAVGLSFGAAAQEPTPEPPALPPPAANVTIPAPPLAATPLSLHVSPTPDAVSGWRRARIVDVTGTLLGLAGSAVSLASVIYIAATHDPMRNTELNPPSPTDTGPVLAYVGSSASAVGFVLSASALGYQHHLLDRLGVDPGRGRFAAGTAIGTVGFVSVGASYLFGLTHLLDPHDQEIAILATTIGGAGLCAVAGLFYLLDSSRNKKAWRSLGTF